MIGFSAERSVAVFVSIAEAMCVYIYIYIFMSHNINVAATFIRWKGRRKFVQFGEKSGE